MHGNHFRSGVCETEGLVLCSSREVVMMYGENRMRTQQFPARKDHSDVGGRKSLCATLRELIKIIPKTWPFWNSAVYCKFRSKLLYIHR